MLGKAIARTVPERLAGELFLSVASRSRSSLVFRAGFRLYRRIKGIQLNAAEASLVFECLKTARSFLVFGVGNDTPMWRRLGPSKTIFLEDDDEWASRFHEQAQIRKVTYRTQLSEANELLGRDEALGMDLPREVTDDAWDVILIDGPRGYGPSDPGRMQSILAAARLIRAGGCVLLHDYDRAVERQYGDHYFGKPVEVRERLALFRCGRVG